MQAETIRDQMRCGILEKSVQILRRHGMSDEEIRIMILRYFHIKEETLAGILNAG